MLTERMAVLRLPQARQDWSPPDMTTLRTRLLTSCAVLLGLMLAAPIALAKVIPYLFEKFATDSTIFVSVHFQPLPFVALLILWIAVVICARISFLHDKGHSSLE
jgi:ABC-type proline/glycine betaine transport system permease subunit